MSLDFIEEIVPSPGEGYLLKLGGSYEVFFHAFCEGDILSEDFFYSKVLVSPYVKESEWRDVIYRTEDGVKKTVGMVFTASSLEMDSEIGGQSDAKKSYATNAVISLLRSSHGVNRLKESSVHEEGDISLLSLFGEKLAIAIFDRRQMSKLSLSEEDMELFIYSDGYQSLSDIGSKDHFALFGKKKAVYCLSPDLEDDREKLVRAFRFANGSYSSSACFISLYQIIEVLIDKIFYHEVSCNIVPSISDFTTWDLKEKLKDISGEKNRIKIIDEKCSSNGEYARASESLAEECKAYLEASGVEVNGGGGWVACLYLVRNQVVHRQYFIVDEAIGLDKVCKEFRNFLVLMVSRFHLNP